MTKYAKLIDGNLYFPPKNKDGICNYDLDIERLLNDGYKEFIDAERLVGYTYRTSYTEDENSITEILEIVKTPEERQRENFKKEFFNTSLGYISRIVHMKDGTTKNFLSDVVPRLRVGTPIITYNLDGSQNLNVAVTAEFIEECDNQFYKDFYGNN